MNIASSIAEEINVAPDQVTAAMTLLDEGATVPFIARYRKEQTRGLDDTQLRTLEMRLVYLRELQDRKTTILKSITEQDKLTPALETAIQQATTKTAIEDLYLPYKPKRRTKAAIAREAGLEALADRLLQHPEKNPEQEAESFLCDEHNITNSDEALEGAKQILMERFAEDAALLDRLREQMWQQGVLSASVVKGKESEGQKFADYFDYSEQIAKIPSHRALALMRGRNEDILALHLDLPELDKKQPHPFEGIIAAHVGIQPRQRAADDWLASVVRWSWKVKLSTRIDLDLKQRLREQAETTAINVFALNLKDLLLAAPAGQLCTLGLDPGLRTGVKVAIVDATGKLLATDTIYPHVPRNQWDQSLHTLSKLIKQHHVQLISIGNGTGSRETDKLVIELIKQNPALQLKKLVVSEAGASVYSASQLAADEFPDLDVSLRGAVSIARRLQDPLAELVKIEPKSIGVGQYQHDVNQVQLNNSLASVVEDCVNAVGVDVNTASPALLTHISGLNATLAKNIVQFRDENGAFSQRKELLKVPRLGPKAFEQSAGFLRIPNGKNALDASAVHPEAYPLVKQIVATTAEAIDALIGNSQTLKNIEPRQFISDQFGLPTIQDVLAELEKPGRDPRPEFKTAEFKEGVEKISDLKADMVLEGVVTNVTNFGAFVDVGVHQDGLVHISALADRFVKDPHDVVSTGDLVKVKVVDVDVQRKRIALTMKLNAPATPAEKPMREKRKQAPAKQRQPKESGTLRNSAMADALLKAKQQKR